MKSIRASVPLLLVASSLLTSCAPSSVEGEKQAQQVSAPGTIEVTHEESLVKEKSAASNAYICDISEACSMSVTGASSAEEAQWLKAYGYPSSTELVQLEKLSLAQLKGLSDDGSLPAMVVYGRKAALEDGAEVGLSALKVAADRGSIYAYHGLSEVFAKRKDMRDVIDAAAYLRVAYILGDTKAATELQANFPGLGAVDNRAIDKRAAELYRTFAKQKRPAPRPT